MKKCIFRVIIIALAVLLGVQCFSWATDTSIDTDILSKSFTNEFSPNGGVPGDARLIITPIINITNKIFGILQVVGGLLTVVSIAFLGFNKILTADEELTGDFGIHNPHRQVKLIKIMRGIVIGAFILFSSATIVRIVFKIFIK